MFAHIRISPAGALAGLMALALSAEAKRVGPYHVFPMADSLAPTGQQAPDAPLAGSMRYYGGSVTENAKVLSVIWGSSVNPAIVAGIPRFSAAIVNSTYVDQLSPQYDTFLNAVDGREGTQQHIGRGSYLGQVVITPKHTSKNLTDEDVRQELKKQIKTGVLPSPDLNSLYMVYFPADVTITLGGLTSCIDFAAYHSAKELLELRKKNAFYSVQPDCHFSFDAITFLASRSFVGTVTNNIPTPGSFPDFPQAWNTANGLEIGDQCGGTGQLVAGAKSYTVTQIYLNTTGRCSIGNYASP
jgi:hypothetical protein